MAIKLLVACQKGGIGKTTSTVLLGEILAQSGYRVLVVDLDTQGNATQMISQKNIYEYSEKTILEAIKERNPVPYIFRSERTENLHYMAAEDMLITFSRYIYTARVKNPLYVLGETLEKVDGEYDFILLDSPPNLGDIVLNAICYADYVLIPMFLGGFCDDAVVRFIDFIEDAKANGHTDIDILGIFFTMRHSRDALERDLAESFRATYGDLIFQTEIKARAKIKRLAFDGVSIQRKSDVETLEDYLQLVEEVIERVKK